MTSTQLVSRERPSQGSGAATGERQPQEGEAVSASDNPEIKSQVLQSNTPNAKRKTEMSFLSEIHF